MQRRLKEAPAIKTLCWGILSVSFQEPVEVGGSAEAKVPRIIMNRGLRKYQHGGPLVPC